MNTTEKCEAILKKMLEIANNSGPQSDTYVSIGPDWGEFSATVVIGESHTHIGMSGEDGDWETFVNQLYAVLHGGPGLSWVAQFEGDQQCESSAGRHVDIQLQGKLQRSVCQGKLPVHGHIPEND